MADTNLLSMPGGNLVVKGLEDLAAGRTSAESLLVLIGRPRLTGLGFDVPSSEVPNPEHALYALLAAEDAPSAHSRYNALLRRLVSFEHAVECAT